MGALGDKPLAGSAHLGGLTVGLADLGLLSLTLDTVSQSSRTPWLQYNDNLLLTLVRSS